MHSRIKRFYLLSLGCPKNDVDSDYLASRLMQVGWTKVGNPREADLLLVNSCSFIVPAVEETVEVILDLSDLRDGGRRKLVVAGCLVSRYGASSLSSLLPEVDKFLEFSEYAEIAPLMDTLMKGAVFREAEDEKRAYSATLEKGYVYIKISEGCRRRCTFCTIPTIRGPLCSRRWEDVCEESRFFIARGARELVLVAQDTTSYGLDLYGKPSLPLLIDHLTELDGDYMLRVMYMQPAGIDREIVESMRHPRVCSYLDIPFQHVEPAILEAMGRQGGRDTFRALVDMAMDMLGKAAIRSTFMVGFPGEDEASFRKLYDFIVETRFDWLGLFRYSHEEGTPAYSLSGVIPEVIGKRRLEALAEVQGEIMRDRALDMVGEAFRVLVEGKSLEAPGFWEARSWREAPEIDGVIFLPDSAALNPGMYCEVVISGTEGIDLIGVLRDQKKGEDRNKSKG